MQPNPFCRTIQQEITGKHISAGSYHLPKKSGMTYKHEQSIQEVITYSNYFNLPNLVLTTSFAIPIVSLPGVKQTSVLKSKTLSSVMITTVKSPTNELYFIWSLTNNSPTNRWWNHLFPLCVPQELIKSKSYYKQSYLTQRSWKYDSKATAWYTAPT